MTTDNDCYCCIAEKKTCFCLVTMNINIPRSGFIIDYFCHKKYRFPFFVNYTANAMDIFFMQDNNHSDFMTVYLLLSLVNYDIVIELWRFI